MKKMNNNKVEEAIAQLLVTQAPKTNKQVKSLI